ncbi:MAG TPA: ACP S-malonyltransferase [Candidatus Polarisedimenticolia bacterium]|nr:ACP S-malonyltransferase [Candidatus Polarisedimenticolia bacterium]
MIAFVFPGQGSQIVGMGRDLSGAIPICRDVFEEADEALGFSLSRVCFEGPESDLQMTAVAQPAILTVSVAALRALGAEGFSPGVVAGHSLGEYSALVAAGGLAFRDAVRLVRARGLYMQEAVPVGRGTMAAIIGLDLEKLRQVCADAARESNQVVSPANLNAPGQTVISGATEAVQRAVALAQQHGARRAVMLPVSAPFHCEMMAPAAQRLAVDIAASRFDDLRIPLVTNVDARPIQRAEDARTSLVRQVTAPVLWESCVNSLASMGVTKAIEVGPGKVLCGLIKRIAEGILCAPAGDLTTLASARGVLS